MCNLLRSNGNLPKIENTAVQTFEPPTNRKGHTTMTATKTNTQTAKSTKTTAAKPTSARTARPKATLPKVTATVVKSGELEKAMNKPVSGVVVYEKEFVEKFKKHDNAVRKGFKDAGKSFFTIAFNLYWIHVNEGYKTAGKDNIYDYARDCFDISRGTTHNYITVAERFGRMAIESDILVIRDEYAAYSPSQLAILAPHSDEEIKALEIKPTLSCREIKRKFTAAIEAADVTEVAKKEEEADKSSPESETETTDTPAPEPVRTVLITCKGKDDYLSHEDTVFDLIHNLLTKKPGAKIEISYFSESES